MKVAASFLIVLVTLNVSVTGHAGTGKPALMARHARAVRERETVSPVNGSHINTYNRRACNPRPTVSHTDLILSSQWRETSVTSPALLPEVSPGVSMLIDPLSDALATTSTPVTSHHMPSSVNSLHIGPINGLVNVVSAGSCGPSGATTQITALSGPNGNIDFLDCGLTSGGWTPPLIHINDVVGVELSQVAHNPGSAFFTCKDFTSIFEKYGRRYNVPAVMLASFAMEESSCILTAVGGAGEQGLMQITVDKCDGAPGGNCQDPDFNIHKGAEFFSQTFGNMNGDLLLSIGHYNGWYKGLTYAAATAPAHNGNCHEQNNLDYLHQFLNGWMQDINPYENKPPLGKYFNLNACSN